MGLAPYRRRKGQIRELCTFRIPWLFLTLRPFNPISWWNDAKPSLQLYAFDTLAIPAMFAEREKVL